LEIETTLFYRFPVEIYTLFTEPVNNDFRKKLLKKPGCGLVGEADEVSENGKANVMLEGSGGLPKGSGPLRRSAGRISSLPSKSSRRRQLKGISEITHW